jgi:small-conductance mechanosensitive channel
MPNKQLTIDAARRSLVTFITTSVLMLFGLIAHHAIDGHLFSRGTHDWLREITILLCGSAGIALVTFVYFATQHRN